MIRRAMRLMSVLLLGLALLPLSAEDSASYSRAQLREDLSFLYTQLKSSHYNLFVHTSEKAYDAAYRELQGKLPEQATLLETYRLFQPFMALAGLVHSNLDYPFNRPYGAHISAKGKVFPINVTIEGEKALIKAVYPKDPAIEPGAELLAINGRPMKHVLAAVHRYLSGDSVALKGTMLDLISLPRIMWILEDTAASYAVKVRHLNGKIQTHTLDAISAETFEEMVSTEPEVFHSQRIFKFIDEVAYIKPGPFLNANADGNTSKTETFEKGEFMEFIDKCFAEIARKKANALIVDLRYNSGGSDTFSNELVAYFAERPFRFCSRFEVRTSPITKAFWQKFNEPGLEDLKRQILSHADGERFTVDLPHHAPNAEPKRFHGRVVVLVNRYSYSQATVTAAMIQDYGLGTVIGEVTADLPTTYGSIHQFSLPHSGISVNYPKALVVRPNGDTRFVGTVPDIVVPVDSFSTRDDILLKALDFIRQGGEKAESGRTRMLVRRETGKE